MIRRIFLVIVLIVFAFNICAAQDLTLEQVRMKITYTRQELDRLVQTEPKTSEIDQKIMMLREKLLNLKNMEQEILEQQKTQPVTEPVTQTPESKTSVSTTTSSSSSQKTSSSSSNKTAPSQNISEATRGAATSTGSSFSETLTQPTVMAAMISAFAVIATTLLGIFAKRK